MARPFQSNHVISSALQTPRGPGRPRCRDYLVLRSTHFSRHPSQCDLLLSGERRCGTDSTGSLNGAGEGTKPLVTSMAASRPRQPVPHGSWRSPVHGPCVHQLPRLPTSGPNSSRPGNGRHNPVKRTTGMTYPVRRTTRHLIPPLRLAMHPMPAGPTLPTYMNPANPAPNKN